MVSEKVKWQVVFIERGREADERMTAYRSYNTGEDRKKTYLSDVPQH